MTLKIWFAETRPQFLILSLVLTILGGALASFCGRFSWTATIAAGVGLTLLHVSVNVLNDYHDFVSGLDLRTTRTPFSGGSGILVAGAMKPTDARFLGLSAFALSVPIGIYFLWLRGWALLPLLAFGAIAVLLYTSKIQKIGFGVAEVTAGLGLGMLPVLGVAFVNLGRYDPRAVFASVPSGFLVMNLLLMNEFPDREADASVGRRTLPVQFGWTAAAAIYTLAALATYAWISTGVVAHILPPWSLLALLTLPVAGLAVSGLYGERSFPRLVRSQGANVMVVLITQLLFAIGLWLGR